MPLALMSLDQSPPPSAPAPPAPATRVSEFWSIYLAPTGSPAKYMVVRWTSYPGQVRSVCHEPTYAASKRLARTVVPRGLVKSSTKRSVDRLIETWRERK